MVKPNENWFSADMYLYNDFLKLDIKEIQSWVSQGNSLHYIVKLL